MVKVKTKGGFFKMDHVINDLRRWLEIYEGDPPEEQDEKAIVCIKNALKELTNYREMV